MVMSWRWLAYVCIASVCVGVGVARAQTVVVRDAPAGAAISLQLNAGTAKSATADASGDARLELGLPAGTSETSARFIIDVCGTRVALSIVTPGVVPDPTSGCARTEIPWLFVMRPITSFVVNLGGPAPTVSLRQGPVPPEWLVRGVTAEGEAVGPRFDPPSGLMLSGGVGLSGLGKFVGVACGDTSCSASDVKTSFAAGVTYWMTPFFGAQVTVVKPSSANVDGAEGAFKYDSSLDARLLTIGATAGPPTGRVRPYGSAGVNYHKALFIQNETFNDTTVTVNGVATTVPGGTQTWEIETRGWGWQVGGGLEIWLTRVFALYGEGQYAWLRGDDTSGGEAKLNEHLTTIVVGARVHLWR